MNISRRNALQVLAGSGSLLTGFPAGSVSAQTGQATGRRIIDVHHHIIPPFYLEENRQRIAASRSGQITPAWLNWSPEAALAEMDNNDVATSVLSLSTPGVWFGDAVAARTTARRSNEFAANLVKSYPGRFGLFAAVPLPDQEGSLKEIEYAFDVLKADGIGLITSYGDKWLGDPAFAPVFDELNRRKAVVFVHPTTPNCCRTLLADVAPLVAEVPQDTTRTIANLMFTGALLRYRDIRFIFTHAGGTMPMVVDRMTQYGPKDLHEKAPLGVAGELQRHFYDIAGTAHKPAIAALTALIPTTQILFGSDNPYVPLTETAVGLKALGLSQADMDLMGWENARRLLPQLRAG